MVSVFCIPHTSFCTHALIYSFLSIIQFAIGGRGSIKCARGVGNMASGEERSAMIFHSTPVIEAVALLVCFFFRSHLGQDTCFPLPCLPLLKQKPVPCKMTINIIIQ